MRSATILEKMNTTSMYNIGSPIPVLAWQKNLLFNCSTLMVASYENVADIRERVAKVITTYKQ